MAGAAWVGMETVHCRGGREAFSRPWAEKSRRTSSTGDTLSCVTPRDITSVGLCECGCDTSVTFYMFQEVLWFFTFPENCFFVNRTYIRQSSYFPMFLFSHHIHLIALLLSKALSSGYGHL